MTRHKSIVSRHKLVSATSSQYIKGYIASMAITGLAFYLAMNYSVKEPEVILSIVGLALVQLIVQLRFFIHLDHETGVKWNKVIFSFMALVVFVIVAGSLWIMFNLDYHHEMTPQETEHYLLVEEGLKP